MNRNNGHEDNENAAAYDDGVLNTTNTNFLEFYFFQTKWKYTRSSSPLYLLQRQAPSHKVPHGEEQRVQLKFLLIM